MKVNKFNIQRLIDKNLEKKIRDLLKQQYHRCDIDSKYFLPLEIPLHIIADIGIPKHMTALRDDITVYLAIMGGE